MTSTRSSQPWGGDPPSEEQGTEDRGVDSLDADGLPRLQEALARFDGPDAVFEHGLRALVAGFRAGSPD